MVDIKGEFLGFGVVTALTYAQYLTVQVAVLLEVGGRGVDGGLAAYLYVIAAVEWCVDAVLRFFSPGASGRLGGRTGTSDWLPEALFSKMELLSQSRAFPRPLATLAQ